MGKAWSDSQALKGDYESHDYVAFKGTVKRYRDQLQLNVQDCRRATEADRERGFDEAKLIPSAKEDVADLWRRLQALYPETIQRPVLRRLASELALDSLVLETDAPDLTVSRHRGERNSPEYLPDCLTALAEVRQAHIDLEGRKTTGSTVLLP